MGVTARKIDYCATEILTSNPNNRAELSAASKANCSSKRKLTQANDGGERGSGRKTLLRDPSENYSDEQHAQRSQPPFSP